MRTPLIATLVAAFVAGCASTATSGLTFYRPKGAEQQHAISASRHGDNVTVTIDGEPAARGALDGDRAAFFGDWRGRRVATECSKKVDGNQALALASIVLVGWDATSDRYTSCTVYLDGDPAAHLQLR